MQHHVINRLRLSVPLWFVVLLVSSSLAIGFGGGYLSALEVTSPCPLARSTCAELSNFWEIWSLASKYYVDPDAVDPDQMVTGAINGMLDSLGDRGHTRYLPPEVAEAAREALAGQFEGIGAYIGIRGAYPEILQVIEGSPAERAGLRANDIITHVDGREVAGMTIDEILDLVRGPKGTDITLTVIHADEQLPIELTITRDAIEIPSVTWRMLPEQIAYIQLIQFSGPSSEQIEAALRQAQQQGAQAVILDLRNNPGGLVTELVEIASLFLPADSVVLLEEDRSGQRTPYTTSGEGLATEIPLVVLVNQNSASAGEILAGSLRDNNRATVIGVPTFGTATVLQPFNLDDGAQVRIGTSQWLTPSGEEVRGVGITPDELVALPPGATGLTPAEAADLSQQELLASDDTQLARAFELAYDLAAQRGSDDASG